MEMFDVFHLTFVKAKTAKADPYMILADGTVHKANKTIHHTLVIGQDALIEVQQAGEGNMKTIMKGLGSSGTNDPLDQRQTVG